jgi:hypothetical protein
MNDFSNVMVPNARASSPAHKEALSLFVMNLHRWCSG